MKKLAIFGHPDWASSQVSAAWFKYFEQQGDITLHKLINAQSNWCFDVAAEQQLLANHDRIILIFPIRWYGEPSLVKKWCEDIILDGFAYGSRHALKGKELLIAASCGGVAEIYRTQGRNCYPLDIFLAHWQAISHLCGLTYYPAYALYGVYHKTTTDYEEAGTKLLQQFNSDKPTAINSL
ncbi:MAG: NAD(P)H-dependent oxidoreductase [Spirochaetaceae bacterium]|nr:NAD(P)H-dependent oxidoreductase [Spirochaetaceae bacterium]